MLSLASSSCSFFKFSAMIFWAVCRCVRSWTRVERLFVNKKYIIAVNKWSIFNSIVFIQFKSHLCGSTTVFRPFPRPRPFPVLFVGDDSESDGTRSDLLTLLVSESVRTGEALRSRSGFSENADAIAARLPPCMLSCKKNAFTRSCCN